MAGKAGAGVSVTGGMELNAGRGIGAARPWGMGRRGGRRRRPGFQWEAQRRGAGSRAHLKSLSLDVIFSRRLEMWKAAVLMVTARRGAGLRERIWRHVAPSPA